MSFSFSSFPNELLQEGLEVFKIPVDNEDIYCDLDTLSRYYPHIVEMTNYRKNAFTLRNSVYEIKNCIRPLLIPGFSSKRTPEEIVGTEIDKNEIDASS